MEYFGDRQTWDEAIYRANADPQPASFYMLRGDGNKIEGACIFIKGRDAAEIALSKLQEAKLCTDDKVPPLTREMQQAIFNKNHTED